MRNWERAVGRAIGIGVGAVAVGAAGLLAGGTALARRVVTPELTAAEPVTVTRISRDGERVLVWLTGHHAELPGQYSLLFDRGHGHARLGPVAQQGVDGTAREVLQVDRGSLTPGLRGRLTGWWYSDPEALGLSCERITYPTELGDAEAWVLRPRRAKRGRWAVHVHGRGALPEETLRGVPPLARAGVSSLVISYRNDPGAPGGEFGRYGVGVAESRDVDAALAEVRRRGAERVTLFGWSMGGTAVLRSATTGPYAALIDGLILDSPAVDWPALLRHQAAGVPVPRPFAEVGIELLQRGLVKAGEPGGIDFPSLSPERVAEALQVPTLIHASRGDTFVPSAGAEELAAARPELVQLRLQREGEHVRLWNTDPESWERATEQFVRALPRPAWRGELPTPPVRLD
ncbi:Secreted protein [Leucobacter sp. 7(1)]|uniref:alpha/beta hydrolase family protein n=1 Tax=Leucobacter sp. 7(1) TaxID=1255613 RepID=UPI00097EDB90|nr:alpha/beta fold hydrolase [Leucobacter sp. 7(1)]SJN08158.1 Secreted protein [Leucobacter sp. 7(1)]